MYGIIYKATSPDGVEKFCHEEKIDFAEFIDGFFIEGFWLEEAMNY